MSLRMRFAVLAAAALLSACSGMVGEEDLPPDGRSVPVPAPMAAPSDTILVEPPAKYVDDDRPMHLVASDQVKRVEVRRTIVKPVFEAVPVKRKMSPDEAKSLVDQLSGGEVLSAGAEYDNPFVSVLVGDYRNLLAASASCCPFTIIDYMKHGGVPSRQIMEFFADDSSDYSAQNMCMILSDRDALDIFASRNLVGMVQDAKRECICNNADALREILANFYAMYEAKPRFFKRPLIFQFRNSAGQTIRQDMIESVVNITAILKDCK